MRTYLKILLITLSIQIVLVGLGLFCIMSLKWGSPISIMFIFLGYIGSLIVDIYMSVTMNEKIHQKLICIFLMLSNYTPLLLPWLAIQIFINFFEILPKNLG